MKSIRGSVIILFVFLALSCASRPVVRKTAAEEEKPLERALRSVKMNSPRIIKFLEPREAILTGSGYSKVGGIEARGEFSMDGNDYRVSYFFSNAYEIEENLYHISFCLEDLTNNTAHYDALRWSPGEEDAGLLLSFDDYFWDMWRSYFFLFDAYGAKITFFVQGSLDPESADESGLEDFCAEALGRGHSLGFHTVNHLDLRKEPPDVFYSETVEAALVFANRGIHFSAIAFPFGFSEPWMRDTLAEFFHFTRGYGTNIRIYDRENSNNGYIVSKAIDNIVYRDEGKFKNDIRKILLAAKFTGQCFVPFTTHEISDEADWGITPQRLEYVLKTARDLRLKFYTYGSIGDFFPALRYTQAEQN